MSKLTQNHRRDVYRVLRICPNKELANHDHLFARLVSVIPPYTYFWSFLAEPWCLSRSPAVAPNASNSTPDPGGGQEGGFTSDCVFISFLVTSSRDSKIICGPPCGSMRRALRIIWRTPRCWNLCRTS